MQICLVTLNSTYQHAAFGLRYLLANLQEYQKEAQIVEYTIHKPAQDVVNELVALKPSIIGFGVYIWNTSQTLKVVELLKAQHPEIIVVLGGPEVSHETEKQKICQVADYVICGEADFLFYEFCDSILGKGQRPTGKVIRGPLPDIQKIKLPYGLYSENDIKNRIIYVEASRGCPFKCEYCLSSLDKSVRNIPIDDFQLGLQSLIDRGVRQFKFIDRTFNLSPTISTRILQFFLDRIDLGLFLHFEMVPDRLPPELRELILRFPAGSLQFEIGVQTFNPVVAGYVSRRQDYAKVEENLKFLRAETGVHTHVDLIAGLPGETLDSFAAGFNRLAALDPDEIQVGILKRLKGTPIIRHDREWEMNYSSEPPFQILSTKTMSADVILKMQRFSKFWDMIANSGNFLETMKWIRAHSSGDLFQWFWDLTDFLNERHSQAHSIHLLALFESLLSYFENVMGWDIKHLLEADYLRGRPGPIPKFLRTGVSPSPAVPASQNTTLPEVSLNPNQAPTHLPKRQQQRLRQ